jgi:putative membrane protein
MVGVILISTLINFLLKRFYTITFSVIFGLFISIIPKLLNANCMPGLNGKTVLSFALMIIGFCISLFLSDLENNLKKLKTKLKK